MNVDALFANMASADIKGKGTYFEEGLHTVETKDIRVMSSKNPLKPGDLFLCEMTVVESSNPKHAPGSSASWVLNFSNPYTMGNVNELVIALLGYENTKENQENADIRAQAEIVVRATCGSDSGKADLEALRAGLGADYGVLIGKRLKLETFKKPTKPGPGKAEGGVYTVHRWSPVKAA